MTKMVQHIWSAIRLKEDTRPEPGAVKVADGQVSA
jgi:hypothetical protein